MHHVQLRWHCLSRYTHCYPYYASLNFEKNCCSTTGKLSSRSKSDPSISPNNPLASNSPPCTFPVCVLLPLVSSSYNSTALIYNIRFGTTLNPQYPLLLVYSFFSSVRRHLNTFLFHFCAVSIQILPVLCLWCIFYFLHLCLLITRKVMHSSIYPSFWIHHCRTP